MRTIASEDTRADSMTGTATTAPPGASTAAGGSSPSVMSLSSTGPGRSAAGSTSGRASLTTRRSGSDQTRRTPSDTPSTLPSGVVESDQGGLSCRGDGPDGPGAGDPERRVQSGEPARLSAAAGA